MIGHLAPDGRPRLSSAPSEEAAVAPRDRRTSALLTAARIGNAHWLFGNLYEEVVGMPGRIADGPHDGGLLGRHSPVRYHLPIAPMTLGTTLAAAVSGWHRREDRPALAAAAALTVAGAAITGRLVQTVIVRLFDDRLPDDERDRLVAHWHRANRVRLAAAAGAGAALLLAERRALTAGPRRDGQAPVGGSAQPARARISRITGPLASA
jgi:hypothetical protein